MFVLEAQVGGFYVVCSLFRTIGGVKKRKRRAKNRLGEARKLSL